MYFMSAKKKEAQVIRYQTRHLPMRLYDQLTRIVYDNRHREGWTLEHVVNLALECGIPELVKALRSESKAA